MDFSLDIMSNNIGGYFSSEQLDFLSIVQCNSHEELIAFIYQCKQLDGVFSKEDLQSFSTQDLEQLKRNVFKRYQDTLVSHYSDFETILDNTLHHLEIKTEDREVIKSIYNGKNRETIDYIREYIKNRYPNNYENLFRQINRFVSIERDQNKAENLYDEFVFINEKLSTFDTLLVSSMRPENVINVFFGEDNQDRFDFYFAERNLDFARKNNKHVRLHATLTKEVSESFFDGRSKEEILSILSNYVKAAIDFVNNYNSSHRLADGTPVIHFIDLFNEIVSFDKNAVGEYENIWETKYGISIQDICNVFAYAKEHKPEGVSYLYNEPFLEDSERRKKVIQVLRSINSISGGLIDTLGSQMHITFGTTDEQIQECFKDLKELQDTDGTNIQITEFDLSLSERETLKTIGDNPEVSYEQVYEMKKERMETISSLINHSGVRLSGVSYWSLTDNIDCNLERVRANLMNKGTISEIGQVPTVCGGLFPTFLQYVNTMNNSASMTDDFDGEKLLREYESMSKEEAIALLGEEYATILSERLQSGTIRYEEFEQLCHQALPQYPQRANWIMTIIYNKLSKYEVLSMQGVEQQKVEEVAKMDSLKEKVQKGTLTQSELKSLCDITFGENSKESSVIYNQLSGMVKPDEQETYEQGIQL